MAKLTDPWFEAEFYGRVTETGYHRQGAEIEGAQGLLLWCPCGYGKPEYPEEGARPHALLVPFSNPRNAPQVPAEHGANSSIGGPRPRWTVSGSGLHDLTLAPSIANGKPECWHSHIQNGEVQGV